ncbi:MULTISPECIES: SigE family RNA polymerase sigma factor [unclassified Streptomyces]|uniref:SigE family RNA polymerase sigma factor n=1 Tax=unclassified Streptomyces TaxID=2593676 RepID=UPI000938F7DD|nr:SigE family RNA polymerase sigma factor [Streptomyces sp. CB02414]OKI86382.1 RNA polymerase subunit sigma-24 [Streptomyces sp. CB02414]
MHTGPALAAEDDFTAFASAYWSRLVRTAYMLTGDFHEAEDLVQTTLIKVYARWGRVRREDADAYVRRALVNNNRSRHRRRRVAHLLTPLLPDRPQRSRETERLEERDVLMEALAELPERQRAVVVLRYWEDLGADEVARTLGCSPGTVKSQASRALAKLRAHPALAGYDRADLGGAA